MQVELAFTSGDDALSRILKRVPFYGEKKKAFML